MKPSALLLFFTIIGKVIFIDDVWLINVINSIWVKSNKFLFMTFTFFNGLYHKVSNN